MIAVAKFALAKRALSGSAPTNPITITVSYLHVDHFGTTRQNMYWKELETIDTTKIEAKKKDNVNLKMPRNIILF